MRKLIRKMISEAITAGPLGSVYVPDEHPYETLSDALKAKVSKEDFLNALFSSRPSAKSASFISFLINFLISCLWTR